MNQHASATSPCRLSDGLSSIEFLAEFICPRCYRQQSLGYRPAGLHSLHRAMLKECLHFSLPCWFLNRYFSTSPNKSRSVPSLRRSLSMRNFFEGFSTLITVRILGCHQQNRPPFDEIYKRIGKTVTTPIVTETLKLYQSQNQHNNQKTEYSEEQVNQCCADSC